MPRGRKPANAQTGSNIKGDADADLLDDFDDAHLDADAVERLTGHSPGRSQSLSGGFAFDSE